MTVFRLQSRVVEFLCSILGPHLIGPRLWLTISSLRYLCAFDDRTGSIERFAIPDDEGYTVTSSKPTKMKWWLDCSQHSPKKLSKRNDKMAVYMNEFKWVIDLARRFALCVCELVSCRQQGGNKCLSRLSTAACTAGDNCSQRPGKAATPRRAPSLRCTECQRHLCKIECGEMGKPVLLLMGKLESPASGSEGESRGAGIRETS